MASQFSFEAIGTHWTIDIYEHLSVEQEGVLLSAIKERITLFDRTYSRFLPDSMVSKMAREAGSYEMPVDAEQLLGLYHDLYMLTDGLVTPLIGTVLVDAGYDPEYSLQQKKELIAPPAWDEVIEYHHPILEIKKPAQLDFGAAGKGYLIDIVAGIVEQHSITAFCVDAGGDMIQRGDTSLRVGLEHPTNTSQVIGVTELLNKSICGSAGNRRKWQDFHHIIDPKNLASPKSILAVWVIADTTILADGLATCLFFIPAQEIQKRYSFEYLLVRDDFSIEKSDGFIFI